VVNIRTGELIVKLLSHLFPSRVKDLEKALKATVILLELKNRKDFDERTEDGIRRACDVIDGGAW
jgi:hypothetical protein